MPPTALICFIYPSSDSAQTRILSLLTSTGLPYYQSPQSLCTTWNYFTPSQRKRAPFQPLSPSFSISPCSSTAATPLPLVIGGVEVYSDKSGLQIQQKEKWFQEFQEIVKKEDLYARDEEMEVWYPRGGFLSRQERSEEKGFPLIAKFVCKDEKAREEAVGVCVKFCEYVKANEPGVLTYTCLTRPDKKGSLEVMFYERYRDLDAFKGHGGSKEFKAFFKSLVPHIDPKKTKMAEWEELEGSFTGGFGAGKESKL